MVWVLVAGGFGEAVVAAVLVVTAHVVTAGGSVGTSGLFAFRVAVIVSPVVVRSIIRGASWGSGACSEALVSACCAVVVVGAVSGASASVGGASIVAVSASCLVETVVVTVIPVFDAVGVAVSMSSSSGHALTSATRGIRAASGSGPLSGLGAATLLPVVDLVGLTLVSFASVVALDLSLIAI